VWLLLHTTPNLNTIATRCGRCVFFSFSPKLHHLVATKLISSERPWERPITPWLQMVIKQNKAAALWLPSRKSPRLLEKPCACVQNIFPRLTKIIKHTLVSTCKWYNFQIKPAHADVHQGRKFLERAEKEKKERRAQELKDYCD
jgi:hypothetical protein